MTLHFAELFSPQGQVGRRVFDVRLEGGSVLESHDIVARVGFATPDVQTFDVEVDDGLLDIEFVWRASNPKISAIEIEPLNAPEDFFGSDRYLEILLPRDRMIELTQRGCPLRPTALGPSLWHRMDSFHVVVFGSSTSQFL